MIPFRKPKIETFSTKREDYQSLLRVLAQKTSTSKTLGTTFTTIWSSADQLSKTSDAGLRFLATQLKLLVAESELLRAHMVEPSLGHPLKQEIMGEISQCISQLSRLYADSDLPRAYDKITKLYVNLYDSSLPTLFYEKSEISQSIHDVAESLLKKPPQLITFYNVFRKYTHKIISSNPDVTFAINYINQLFIEKIYESRPYLSKNDYARRCEEFGEHLKEIAVSINKEDRLELYNDIYRLSATTIRERA